MMTRTPALKETVADMLSALRQRLQNDKSGVSLSLMKQLETGQDDLTQVMNNLMHRSARWAPLVLDLTWIHGTPPTGRLFPTSDNPVVRHNTKKPGSKGLMSPGVELHFPVSSKLILVMVDAPSDLSAHFPDRFAYTPENLLHLTHLLVSESSRFLFSQDGIIDFQPGMLRDKPRVIGS